jgi:hypothetical protein
MIEKLIEEFGASGFPKCVDKTMEGTWNKFQEAGFNNSNRARVLDVLGFLHLLKVSGLRKYTSFKTPPEKVYGALLSSEMEAHARTLSAELVSSHLFLVLKPTRSRFRIVRNPRTSERTIVLDMCLEPIKPEPLDSVLTRLQGSLYYNELPLQLREQWKKLPIKSKLKPKSKLPDVAR